MSIDLKIDSKATLHEPIEIEVDGKVLRVRTQTLKTLRVIQKLWEDMRSGSAEAVAAALGAIFDGDTAVLEDLPLQKLSEVIEFAIARSTSSGGDKKNPPGPGEKP